MKRIISASVALSLVVVLGLVPAATAQQPTQDSVVGSGTSNFWGGFEIDAQSGPSGENPVGFAGFQSVVGLLAGPVSCLAVRDNVATFNVPGTPYGLVTFEVTDNAGLGTADVIRGIPTGRSASDCSLLTESAVSDTVNTGDIVVVDAPPLPTSKDQCKHGGWQTFPGFKNQGDCVSFVAMGGRNHPAG